MAHARRAGLVGALLSIAACSGGGGGGSDPPPPVTYTLSGTVRAAAATDADGDTNDVTAPQVQNDTFGTAQVLPSAVTVGGWASTATDPQDWYRAALGAGQVITLRIASATTADLDLYLLAVSDPTTPVAASEGITAIETIAVATAGEYYVVVQAAQGTTSASGYVLNLGQAPLAASGAATFGVDAEFVPGEALVRFRDDVLPAGLADGLEARAASVGLVPISGGARREMLLGLGTGAARARAFAALGLAGQADLAARALDPVGAEKADTIALVKALRRRPDVASADPNYVHHPSAVPNDEFYGFQWHYPLIKLPQAWDVTTGAPATGQVIVAVVDTGVFLAHPDLSSKLVSGYDFISDPTRARDGNGIDASPDDPGDSATLGNSSYHGTHVAGTVAAASNNTSGVAGTSWAARIMPIRVLGMGGGTSADIMNGIRFAAGLTNASGTVPAQKADVVNLSLGCQGCFSSTEQAVYDQVRAAGVVIVAAAGNENSGVAGYPASYAGVISVSAVDMQPSRAPYSNFGPNVDIAAPGGDTSADRDGNGRPDGVASTWADDSSGTRQPGYLFLQGTSMASPHVAGVVALMKAVCGTLTPAQVDAILASGGMTVELGASGRDDLYGFGLVDAFLAVQSAQAACSQTPATTLDLTPTRLDFGSAGTALSLTAAKKGTGTLPTVTATHDGGPWLTVTSPGGNGLGTWSVSVSRTGLAAGVYGATITFTAGGNTVLVPVTMQVGGVAAGAGDVGHVFVLVTDANLNVVGQAAANASSGQYAFSIGGLSAGSYFVFAGTDHDGDDFICDDGEACGAYPDVAAPVALEVSADRAGVQFTVGYEAALGGAGKASPGAVQKASAGGRAP